MEQIKALVFGAPGSGKSILAAGFPAPYFISTDSNLEVIKKAYAKKGVEFNYTSLLKKDNIYTTSSGKEVVVQGYEYMSAILKKVTRKDHPAQTIVIDLLTDVVEFIEDKIARDNGKSCYEDVPFGAGYPAVKQMINELCRDLANSGKHFVLLCHDDYLRIGDGDDRKIVGMQPTVGKGRLTFITRYCSMWSLLTVNEAGERVLLMEDANNSSANRWGIQKPIKASYKSLIEEIAKTELTLDI